MDEAVALLEGAGVGQTGWEAALDSVARVTGSMGAQLIGLGRDALIPFNLMTGVPPEAVADFEAAGGGDPRVNSRVRVGSRSDELVVLDEAAFTTEADMRRHPDYANWIHTYDMHHTCLTTLVKGPDSLVGLALLRGRRHGHINDEAKRAFARLAGRGVPHAYLTFEGEGHGFRRAETMVRALEAELSLYAQVFGLKTPGIPALELTP